MGLFCIGLKLTSSLDRFPRGKFNGITVRSTPRRVVTLELSGPEGGGGGGGGDCLWLQKSKEWVRINSWKRCTAVSYSNIRKWGWLCEWPLYALSFVELELSDILVVFFIFFFLYCQLQFLFLSKGQTSNVKIWCEWSVLIAVLGTAWLRAAWLMTATFLALSLFNMPTCLNK